MTSGRHIPYEPPTYHPIQDPATAKWDLSIKRTDYEKLLEGFSPRDMDDKWLCIADKPDAEGNTTVHWYRSWTDDEQIKFAVEAKKSEENDWARFTEITWQKVLGGLEVTEDEAKQRAVNLGRNFVGCELGNALSPARDE